jgi:hypothetical protein
MAKAFPVLKKNIPCIYFISHFLKKTEVFAWDQVQNDTEAGIYKVDK